MLCLFDNEANACKISMARQAAHRGAHRASCERPACSDLRIKIKGDGRSIANHEVGVRVLPAAWAASTSRTPASPAPAVRRSSRSMCGHRRTNSQSGGVGPGPSSQGAAVGDQGDAHGSIGDYCNRWATGSYAVHDVRQCRASCLTVEHQDRPRPKSGRSLSPSCLVAAYSNMAAGQRRVVFCPVGGG